jgi:hypothetical protein
MYDFINGYECHSTPLIGDINDFSVKIHDRYRKRVYHLSKDPTQHVSLVQAHYQVMAFVRKTLKQIQEDLEQ